MFLEHLDLIKRVAEGAARRSGFGREDAEDFVSKVHEKLIADDYAALRKHRGESKLTTYLTAVIHNLFRDFRNHKLGKFRSSAKARKLGPAAVALERLLVRDEHELEAAIRILVSSGDFEESAEELRELAARLPPRTRRRFVGEEVLEHQPPASPGSPAEERVEESERADVSERVEEILNLALRELPARDLLILKMRFKDDCSYTEIASALRLDRRALYTSKDRSFKKLHAVMEDAGLTWDEVRGILGWQGREIRADFRDVSEGEDDDENS
ncbi:MAG: sigma-70 family RNA polymerase sigma factor [bacterium]|nr:sigma-70 family RNA polymerase sigma factor [bacterium]